MGKNNLSKEEALKKLKESKEHLELELISQDEYDNLKEELKPFILDKVSTSSETKKIKETESDNNSKVVPSLEPPDYNFKDWFSWVDNYNDIGNLEEIVSDIINFVENKLVNKIPRNAKKTYLVGEEIKKDLGSFFGGKTSALKKAVKGPTLEQENIKLDELDHIYFQVDEDSDDFIYFHKKGVIVKTFDKMMSNKDNFPNEPGIGVPYQYSWENLIKRHFEYSPTITENWMEAMKEFILWFGPELTT